MPQVEKIAKPTITARNAVIFSMYQQGMRTPQIAERLGISHQAVSQHVQRVVGILQTEDPDNPITNQRASLTRLLPKTERVYKRALGNYKGDIRDLELAVKVSDKLNTGLQVLVPKTQEDKNINKNSIEYKRQEAILTNNLTDALRLDRDVIDVEAITIDDKPEASNA